MEKNGKEKSDLNNERPFIEKIPVAYRYCDIPHSARFAEAEQRERKRLDGIFEMGGELVFIFWLLA